MAIEKIKILGAIQPIWPVFKVNGLDWHCCLASSSKTAPKFWFFFQLPWLPIIYMMWKTLISERPHFSSIIIPLQLPWCRKELGLLVILMLPLPFFLLLLMHNVVKYFLKEYQLFQFLCTLTNYICVEKVWKKHLVKTQVYKKCSHRNISPHWVLLRFALPF